MCRDPSCGRGGPSFPHTEKPVPQPPPPWSLSLCLLSSHSHKPPLLQGLCACCPLRLEHRLPRLCLLAPSGPPDSTTMSLCRGGSLPPPVRHACHSPCHHPAWLHTARSRPSLLALSTLCPLPCSTTPAVGARPTAFAPRPPGRRPAPGAPGQGDGCARCAPGHSFSRCHSTQREHRRGESQPRQRAEGFVWENEKIYF